MNIIGYLQGDTLSRFANLSDIKVEQLDHLVYHDIVVASSTDPSLVPIFGWDHLIACVQAAHAKGTLISTNILGHIENDELTNICNIPALRAQLVRECVDKVNKYELDGFGIDWEWDYGSQNNQANTDALMRELYTILHPLGKLVYICAAMGVSSNSDKIVSVAGSAYVDMILLMCYNYYQLSDIQFGLSLWASYPKSKLYFGVVLDAQSNPNSGDFVCFYRDVIDQLDPPPSQWQANVATINSSFQGPNYPVEGGVLYWHSPDMIKSWVDYARDNGYGGIFFFDVGQDKLQDPRSMVEIIHNYVKGVNTVMVTFNGQVSAQVTSGETVTIKISQGGQEYCILSALTDADGNYSTTYEASPGDYLAQASVPADAKYQEAKSPLVEFAVGLTPRTITLVVK